MKQVLILFCTAALLTSCAPRYQWVATDNANLSYSQAEAKCKFETEKAAPSSDLSKSIVTIAAIQVDIFEKCMVAQGFSKQLIQQQE